MLKLKTSLLMILSLVLLVGRNSARPGTGQKDKAEREKGLYRHAGAVARTGGH